VDLSRRSVLALAAGLPAAAQPALFAAVRARLDAAVSRGDVPWASLLVTKDGRDVFNHAAGTDLAHVDVLRSATKVATVSAVLTLVASDALRLEDPAARYIPAFRRDKSAVTVRQLLSMSSGLPASWPGFRDEMPLADAAAAIAAAPLAAAPGERFIYGNLGLTVAGRVAEVVSGNSWDAFFAEALAKPLGMNFTYVPLATGRLGGGGRTDLASYGRLLKMHLAGGVHQGRRILSAELVRAMQNSNGAAFRNPIPDTQAYGYGMGWWFDAVTSGGQPRIVSDPGAWGAYPWIDRERRYGAFLFVRKTLAAGVALQRELRPPVERALAE
jgi:CubicO group peptidase (beta-lactamase class C family)